MPLGVSSPLPCACSRPASPLALGCTSSDAVWNGRRRRRHGGDREAFVSGLPSAAAAAGAVPASSGAADSAAAGCLAPAGSVAAPAPQALSSGDGAS